MLASRNQAASLAAVGRSLCPARPQLSLPPSLASTGHLSSGDRGRTRAPPSHWSRWGAFPAGSTLQICPQPDHFAPSLCYPSAWSLGEYSGPSQVFLSHGPSATCRQSDPVKMSSDHVLSGLRGPTALPSQGRIPIFSMACYSATSRPPPSPHTCLRPVPPSPLPAGVLTVTGSLSASSCLYFAPGVVCLFVSCLSLL